MPAPPAAVVGAGGGAVVPPPTPARAGQSGAPLIRPVAAPVSTATIRATATATRRRLLEDENIVGSWG